jgi:threonine dehydratase
MLDEDPQQMDPESDSTSLFPEVPSYADIHQARLTLDKYLPKTPLVYSNALSEELNAEVYLKRDDVLPTGAFKIRGGMVLANELSNQSHSTTLITASTGNHGQSIAYAGRELSVPVEIVVPNDANKSKVTAIEQFGATVSHSGESMDEAFVHAQERAERESFRFVHPANEPGIIAGVATSGLEVVQELPEVDAVFVPVGSGSYASGYCLTTGSLAGADVIAVQSEGADAAYRTWHSSDLESIEQVTTFAEGIAVGTSFELTSHILQKLLTDFIRVSDDDLRKAIRTVLTKEHILAEAAGVASVAGAIANRKQIEGQTVVLPICGRNLSTAKLRSIITSESNDIS